MSVRLTLFRPSVCLGRISVWSGRPTAARLAVVVGLCSFAFGIRGCWKREMATLSLLTQRAKTGSLPVLSLGRRWRLALAGVEAGFPSLGRLVSVDFNFPFLIPLI